MAAGAADSFGAWRTELIPISFAAYVRHTLQACRLGCNHGPTQLVTLCLGFFLLAAAACSESMLRQAQQYFGEDAALKQR
jgi:hypothetical protein